MPQFRGTEIASLLLALVVVPLVSFMVVMKWKAAAARKSEIRKLLVMAADEAGKVEADAAAEYTNSVSTFNGDHQCAVCLSPTTSRCSKCKAVRYCSGKCQIIHWRQGHKQECQPPVIYNSSASMPCVSSPRSEADSTALFETPGLRSFDHNSEEPRNCASTIRKLDLYGSENPEVCASELTSVLKMGSDVTNDTSDPEIVNMIDSGPCAVMSSIVPSIPISGMHLSRSSSTSVASVKDAPNNDISGCESNVPDVSISHSVSLPNDLGSGVPSSREVNTHHSEILVSDIPPFTKTINVVHDFKSNTLNLPVPKNLTCSPPVSSGSLDNPTALRISEHEVHSSASFAHNLSSSTYQMADLFIPSNSGKSPINSKNPVCNLSVSKSPLQHSSSIRSHMVDPPLSKTSMADISQPDAPSSRSCADNIASAQNSVPHSSCLQASLSSGLSLSSLGNCDGRSSSTCSITSIFQSSMPNEWNAARSVPEIRTLRTSVLNTTSRRSFGTVQEDSFPCRKGDSMLTISSKTSGNLSEESSDAVQIANHTGNGLKRSEKIIALQSKSLKASKQIAGGQKMDNLPKSSKMLFSYEYFVKLFNCDKLELPPCGLINCGNSCYANVVLQCLTYTRPLAAYLLQGCHSEQCQTKDWCFMCELEHLVSRVRGRESPLSPIRILSRIQSIGNHLGYGRQEDAHEFLRFAIDSMQSICLDEAGGQMAVNPTAHLTTFIQQMFGGYLQSKVKCKQCHHESNRYEVMMDLTVEVQGNIESLEDALAQFTAPELLDGENKYKCDSCKSYVKARKWLTVHEAPNILTIALKRFQTGSFGKLNKLVVFPEVLDMLPYMSGTGDKPPLYKLYAVVVHLDMLNASYFGHYVCYVKDLQGDWYKIDDSKVTPVGLDMVMSEGAYMLLYSRSSPRPPAVLKDGIAQTCTTVLVNNCTYDTEQSSLSNGHDEKFGVHATQFPSLDACTADTVDGSHPAIVGISDYNANDVDSCNAVNLDAFHFDHNRISSILGDGDIHLISRGYEDLASSDAGSLFSGSDETSCSTDSNWDSTSIVDNVEAVVGDPKNLPCSSSSVSEFCNASTSMFSRRSSPGPAQRELIFENDAYFLHSSFSNQHLGKRRIGQGLCCVSNPHSLDPDRVPLMPSNSHCLDISPRDRDTLDCRVSNTNKYGCLKSPNFGASKSGDYSNHISNEDFAGPAKRRYKKEKCMTVEESEKLKFHAPSRTRNSAMNFEHYLVHEPRTLAIPTGHFLGFER